VKPPRLRRSGRGESTFENADRENNAGGKSDGGKRLRAGELKGGGDGSFFGGVFFFRYPDLPPNRNFVFQ
jgi:hypothetical protein